MRFVNSSLSLALVALLATVSLPRLAYADCTSPAGVESKMIWDWTNHVMKTCDGTNWLSMGSGLSSGSAGYVQFSDGSGGFSNSGTTSGEQLFWDDTTKRLGIGTTTPATKLDVLSWNMQVGADWATGTARTDATYKGGYITVPHYTNAQKPMAVIAGMSDVTGNSVHIGGYTSAYNAATDIRFYTAANGTTDTGTERMRITSAGNVGIGTTSPVSALTIGETGNASGEVAANTIRSGSGGRYGIGFNTGVAGTFNLFGHSTAQQIGIGFDTGSFGTFSSVVTVKPSGNVGIGTTTPSAPLTVVQSSAGPATAFYGGYVNIFSNLDADKYGLSLIRSRGTAAVPTATQSGDDFASLNFTGHTGSAYSIGAWIAGSQTGAVGTNIPSALRFATSDGTSIPTERMRISSAGNVGIGTGAPGSKLQVVSTDTAATSGSVMGSVQTQMTVTPAADSSADYTNADDRIILSGTKNVTGSIRGGYAVATHSGSGTLNTAYGSLGIVDNTSSGTIAAAHGAYNYSRASSAGTITSAMGTSSTALTNHASAIVASGYGAINAARTVLGTMTTAVGSFDTVQANAPTTVTVAQATRANLTVASGATITTAYGVLSDLSNSGTVANWYGLYIPAISGTAPTTARYPIYVADTGNNYFAGNVGIGTATPSGALYVKGNTVLSDDTASVTASYPLRIHSASSASGLLNLYYSNADTNGAALSLQKYKGSGNEIAAGDIIGSIDFFGTTGVGNSVRAAQIRATAETGWGGTGDAPGRLSFWTTPDGSSTAVERMRIDSAGNVGIGTTTPIYRFQVNQTDTAATTGPVATARTDLTAAPTADSSATYYATFNRANLNGSANVTGTINSNHNYTTHSGTGTLYGGYGAMSAVDNLGAGTISNGYGAYSYARANSAGAVTSGFGSYSAALTNNASTTMTTGIGAYNTAYTTLGTMTNAYGSYNLAQNSSPTTMALAMGSREYVIVGSGSTVTSAYGVGIYLSNAGTVSNWYGLYIPAISGTAPTTNRYPVYVADTGPNYFAGNVGIGTTTPAAKLDVNGFMRLAKNGSAPATCDSTIDGAIALTSARRMCVCDATSWKEVNSATACTW